MSERWQMNKLGFVNFWFYDWEEFHFSNGRLLLRGENGAGKSVTTQSFIPFMLDGDMRPHRLDSFGSKDRRMEYYLLGQDKEENTGYLYLEFVKPLHKFYRTLVVGMRARRGKQIDFWGFCLSDGRRIGCGEGDFALFVTQGKHHISLSRQEARNQFGGGENWVEKSSDYKQMVSRILFGCKEMEQYDRLLKLLIQIRKPKLSKDFSPNLVREILNESLQPLGEDDIAPMITSMERMDDIQARLENLKASLDVARQLRNEYKRYNDFILGKKGEYYLAARQSANKLQLEAQGKKQEVESTEITLESARTAFAETEQRWQELQAQYRILRQDDQLERDLERKDELGLQKNEIRAKVAEEQDGQNKKQDKLSDKEWQLRRARREYEDQHSLLQDNFSEFDAINKQLQYPGHPKSLDTLEYTAQRTSLSQYGQQLKKALELLRQRRAMQIQLDDLLRERDEANDALQQENRQLREAEMLVLNERDHLHEAFAALEDEALPFWLDAACVQRLMLLAEQYEGLSEGQQIEKVLTERWQALQAPLRDQRSALVQIIKGQQAELNKLFQQKKELEAQRELPPPRSQAVESTRALLRQRGIPHAAFYELVDFDDTLPPERRAMLEAQLLDAGVLDALVLPPYAQASAAELLRTNPDHFLCVENDIPTAEHPLPLHPEASAPPWAATKTLLQHLSADTQGSVYFSGSGQYRQGIIQGCSVPAGEACYIGASARQANRARRLAALAGQIEEKQHEIRETEKLIQKTDTALAQLDEGYQRRPTTQELATALQYAMEQQALVERCERELAEKQAQADRQQKQLNELRSRFLEAAKGFPYEQTVECYGEIQQILEEYAEQFRVLDLAKQKLSLSFAALDGLQNEIDTLNDSLVESSDRIRSLEGQIRRLQAELAAIEERLSQPEMQERKQKLEALRQELDETERQHEKAHTATITCEADLRHLRPELEQKNEQARRAIEAEGHLRALFAEELHGGPGHPEPGNASLWQLAEQAKNGIRQNDRNQTPEELRDSLEKALRRADVLNTYRITMRSLFASDERQLRRRVCIELDLCGQKLDLLVFIRRIESQIAADKQLLSDEDRRLFETILNQTVTTKLSHRINSSQDWVQRMSSIMEKLPTSMGLRFRLAWKGKPADQQNELAARELVELLRKDPAIMGDADREKITTHFRARVEKARELSHSDAAPAPYSELMRQALDFRTWFEFQLSYQRGEQPWKDLNNSAFNSFSGGEKAMAMYIPLLAALSAQYAAADRDAPRLMALDEAFAGVDETNIESMFLLVHQLNLDYIMNSQALWGCYPTVDSLEIIELLRPQDTDVVTILRYHWDGRTIQLEGL